MYNTLIKLELRQNMDEDCEARQEAFAASNVRITFDEGHVIFSYEHGLVRTNREMIKSLDAQWTEDFA